MFGTDRQTAEDGYLDPVALRKVSRYDMKLAMLKIQVEIDG